MGINIKIPELLKISSGYFQMGSLFPDYPSEAPNHELYIESFYIGVFLITIGEFAYFQNSRKTNGAPSIVQNSNLPVSQITWYEAVDYCAWLADLTSEPYRLPTEAEWEYAAKAGQNLHFPTANGQLTPKLANYGNNAEGITKVGVYPPNPFGLYDMAGNVWEWCSSKKGDYANNACVYSYDYPYNPLDGREVMDRVGSSRILRGGCCTSQPMHCRSSARYREFENRSFNYHQSRGKNYFGFRVAKST